MLQVSDIPCMKGIVVRMRQICAHMLRTDERSRITCYQYFIGLRQISFHYKNIVRNGCLPILHPRCNCHIKDSIAFSCMASRGDFLQTLRDGQYAASSEGNQVRNQVIFVHLVKNITPAYRFKSSNKCHLGFRR